MIGVVDACFIIDWANFRRRELLAAIFRLLYVHEEVLGQVRSQRAIEFLGNLLSRGLARLYPWSEAEEREYLLLREEIVSDPRIPSLERPDLLCLVMAKTLGAVLLTENVGVHRVTQFHPRYSGVRVWTALEVLEQLVYAGALRIRREEEFLELVRDYEEDTAHIFRQRRLEETLGKVGEWLRR